MENLIDLPILVLEKILNNLNVNELKILRTTCWTLNSIINQPKYLKEIKIYIKNQNQLKDIVETYKFNIYNMVYDRCGCPFPYVQNKPNILQKFIEKFKWTMTQVKFKTFDSEFVDFLSESSLESLHISPFMPSANGMLNEILKVDDLDLSDLRKLKIKDRSKDVQQMTELLLDKCDNLNHIRLPIWQSVREGLERSPESSEPLINFIENRADQLTIDFGGLGHTSSSMINWLCRADVTNTRIFPITPTILLQICQRPQGLKLRNVQLSSLPDKTELTNRQKSNLDACIESIVMHMLRPEQNYQQKYFPPKAQIKLGIAYATHLEFDPTLNITSIHWMVYGKIGISNRPSDFDLDPKIYQDLFERDPRKLIELCVAQNQPIYICDSVVNINSEVCPKFPNLKVMYLLGAYEYSYGKDNLFVKLEF